MKRSNILIFNPDEMRGDILGHLGNPAGVTPNLDRFVAEDAVSFSNAFCQNPVCVPSRCSFLTGLYPHVYGHRTMEYPINGECKPLFQELKEAGYYVWMNNRNDFIPNDDVDAFKANANTTYIPWGPFVRHHDSDQSKHPHWTDKSFMVGIIPDASQKNPDRDEDTIRQMIKFLKDRPKDQPFCMFAGLFNPHPPYGVEKKYYDRVNPDWIVPRLPDMDEAEKMPSILRHLKTCMHLPFDENDWKEMQRIYFAMCMKVDDYFGRILQALKEEGIYEDTDIYFLSDHGDFVGNYGLPEKNQNTFEDCLTRVPFLIKPHKGEKVLPGIRDGLTELVDFYATVMDYANVKPTHSHFGISLRHQIENEDAPGRPWVFCEGGRLASEDHCMEKVIFTIPCYEARMSGQRNNVMHTKATMIRSKNFKYVKRLYESDEFYDLKKDPGELHNCIDDSEYAGEILNMKMAMLDWYQTTCDIVPFDINGRLGSPVSTLIKKYVPEKDGGQFIEMARQGGFTIEEFEEKLKNL